MKNQIQAQTSKIVPLELQYSKEKKIANIKNPSEIQQLLNYLYVLLNVKADNQLNEIEESVLNGVIITNFSNYTVNEIKHAFRLAVSGSFENLTLYNKLDSIVLGKVMLKYKEFKRLKIKKHLDTIEYKDEAVSEAKKKEIEKEFIRVCIKPYFENHNINDKPLINWSTYTIFKFFNNINLINTTNAKTYEKEESQKRYEEEVINTRNRSVYDILSQKTKQMYLSCIVLHYRADKLKDYVRENL